MAGAQYRNTVLGHKKRATHVDSEHVVPLRFANISEGRSLKKTGVVDQHINLTTLFLNRLDCRGNALSITDVTRHSDCLPAPFFYLCQGLACLIL